MLLGFASILRTQTRGGAMRLYVYTPGRPGYIGAEVAVRELTDEHEARAWASDTWSPATSWGSSAAPKRWWCRFTGTALERWEARDDSILQETEVAETRAGMRTTTSWSLTRWADTRTTAAAGASRMSLDRRGDWAPSGRGRYRTPGAALGAMWPPPDQLAGQIHTTVLNIVFLMLSAFLVIRFLRTGGPAMLRMMDRAPEVRETEAASMHDARSNEGREPVDVTYTCLMHPEVESSEPGRCPKCGMDLRPKDDE
jgi:hypothetical protein